MRRQTMSRVLAVGLMKSCKIDSKLQSADSLLASLISSAQRCSLTVDSSEARPRQATAENIPRQMSDHSGISIYYM